MKNPLLRRGERRALCTPWAVLWLCAILFLCVPSLSPAKFDPSFTWTTLETPHFLIHYHQDGEKLALKAASIAEDIHTRLVPRIKWVPKEKTHLVLVDAMDESNGYTSPIPYNQMVIFLTQPAGETSFGATSYDDWLRLVLTHEYTHLLHLDMVNGGPDTVQSIFGRIYFPNMWQPVFFIEGLATYEETEQTSGGRGRSPGADMVLRMASLEGPFPSIDQASVFVDTWPSGQVPYLFGESFTRYLADRYGRERLAELGIAYSGREFPFLVQSTGNKVLQRSYDTLWSEWKMSLWERYRKQEQEIRAAGLIQSRPMTSKGYQTIYPAYSPDGTRIAYSASNGDEFPSIYLMNADGSGNRKLVENVFPLSASGSGVTWSPDNNRLYYTKLEIRDNTNYYNDIYAYDLKEKREVRITRELRARDPHLSADGRRLIFVMNRMGMTRLATLNDPSSRRSPARQEDIVFLTTESMNQYATPRWSPDGSKIAVTVWQPGGNTDIWLLDGSGALITSVTKDRAIEGAPAWSPDGTILYFSSDRSGVFNLYAYKLEQGLLFRVTNVIGGAFTPSPSPDGKSLSLSSYSSRGFDIHTMPVDPAQWRQAGPYQDHYPRVQYEVVSVETSTKPYSPLSTIYPRFWLPWFGYSQESGWLFGGLTFGQDVVQRHQYFATLLYGPKNNRVWYSLDYFYDGLFPTFHIQASDTDMTYSDLLPYGKDYVERQQTYGASMILPLERFASQHFLTLGYRWQEVSALTTVSPPPAYGSDRPVEGVIASGRLSYLYNNAQRYDFSISPEHGRTIEVAYEQPDKSLGSDFELHKYTGDWHEYVNLPWKHHVLLVRGFVGSSTGDVMPQRAFQLGGDMPGDITLNVDDQTVHLRGYPVNAFRGQKAALATLEYRFPLHNMEHGFDTAPLFFRRVHGAVFAEAGNAWDTTFQSSDLKRSVGAEVRFDMYLFYYLPITLRLGGAFGLDEQGEAQVIIGLWVPVLF
jgi:sugar lactone lactonase YvrE